MQVSEVRIKLVDDSQDRLKAFCSITLDDCFVIRDMKVIEGENGLFVAMPSRKLTDHCPKCKTKNHFRARYCNHCGERMDENRAENRGRSVKYHADIAHPINHECRRIIQEAINQAYAEEIEKSKRPDYQPVDLEMDYDDYTSEIPLMYNDRPGQSSIHARPEPDKRSRDSSNFSEGII